MVDHHRSAAQLGSQVAQQRDEHSGPLGDLGIRLDGWGHPQQEFLVHHGIRIGGGIISDAS
jgi:hypothetical protein